jgi:hypothetical protein
MVYQASGGLARANDALRPGKDIASAQQGWSYTGRRVEAPVDNQTTISMERLEESRTKEDAFRVEATMPLGTPAEQQWKMMMPVTSMMYPRLVEGTVWPKSQYWDRGL